jgi:class 3 adenylate cyclase
VNQGVIPCASCGHANREEARFCDGCGAPLARTCRSCGATLRPAARFCDGCGQRVGEPASAPPERDLRAYTPRHLAEKILTSRSALEGERKQVTVLFADVKGSMELAERLDPEEWHRILDRFLQLLADGVHRFEGTVNQYTGDGIMALFGAPVAHEDHARRACWAALHLGDELRRYARELRRERGLSFAVRMGINSGEVVVGKIGDDLRMDYTAQGHTVGLAQRIEQLAEPGRVYLTERTAALVEGYFRLEDLGAFEIPGVQAPLRVYELGGVGALRTRLDVSRARGFSRFVGRQEEMATLEAALGRALAGTGQVVGAVADAGVGKSRLCFELAERCRARGVKVYQTHCVAHGRMIPYLPVLELYRAYFAVTDRDSDDEVRRKIAGTLLLLDPGLGEALPILFDFMGVPDPARPAPPMEPEMRQRQLLGVVKRVVQARSRLEPALLLWEDLHWIDGGSATFVEKLAEAVAGTRTLLVANFRPEYRASWMQGSSYQQLPLRPLDPAAIDELLGDLLGADPSVAALPALVCERTGGNPFFIEEAVQALVEAGSLVGTRGAYRLTRPVADLAIPPTVQALLASRIDRLEEREKHALQTAAVIGRTFAEPVLRRVAGLPADDLAAALRALVAAEFVYEEALYPEAEYAFKHPLTQEVAYHSQLGERRARVHAEVARAIEEVDAGKLDERAALLAYHCEAAGQTLAAARWHQRAATWAMRSDHGEARRHWERVRALVGRGQDSAEATGLGATACAALLYLGSRFGMPEEEAAALFAEGKAHATAARDRRLLALAFVNYGRFRLICGGDAQVAADLCREAAGLAEEAAAPGLLLAAKAILAVALVNLGRLTEALEVSESSVQETPADLEPFAEAIGMNPYPFALANRALLRVWVRRSPEGERDVERAIALSLDQPSQELLALVHWMGTLLAQLRGDPVAARGHARQAGSIVGRINLPNLEALAFGALGTAHLLGEEWNEAVTAFERALAVVREHRTNVSFEGFYLNGLAEAHLGRGEVELARTLAEKAIAAARARGSRFQEAQGHLNLARAHLRAAGAAARAEVESALARAEALRLESSAAAYEPHVRLARAELARVLGDEAARRRELGEAHRLFVEMGAKGHAERVKRELGV